MLGFDEGQCVPLSKIKRQGGNRPISKPLTWRGKAGMEEEVITAGVVTWVGKFHRARPKLRHRRYINKSPEEIIRSWSEALKLHPSNLI